MPIRDPQGIASFCRALGELLAGESHSIVVESDGQRTADRMTVDAMLEARASLRARIVVNYRVHHRRPEMRQRRPYDDPQYRGKVQHRPISQQHVGSTHLQMLQNADVALVVGGGKNAYQAGMAAAIIGCRVIPVASFGGAGEQLWLDLAPDRAPTTMRGPRPKTRLGLTGDPAGVAKLIVDELASLPRIMIVHGRSADRALLADLLADCRVQDPIILQQEFSPGETVPDKFEAKARDADAAIVLFTPDDVAMLAADFDDPSEAKLHARARQNVILECGWFWGRLGRRRVLLLLKGTLELPSDLAGVVYEHYVDSPVECERSIRTFIEEIRHPGP